MSLSPGDPIRGGAADYYASPLPPASWLTCAPPQSLANGVVPRGSRSPCLANQHWFRIRSITMRGIGRYFDDWLPNENFASQNRQRICRRLCHRYIAAGEWLSIRCSGKYKVGGIQQILHRPIAQYRVSD